ncbi:MAG: hypothetical protein H8E40_12680 [Chloroflexi bacterium]|nr:hypothetical protein [Chloroflexota bacterium]
MRIAIFHDYVEDEVPGGANLTLRRLVKTAPRNVKVVWLSDLLQLNYYQNVIVANTRSISNITLEQALEGKQYVKIHFDYRYVPPKIIKDAVLLVYMSPKQRNDMLGRLTGYKSYVMPSLVDPDMFSLGNGKGHLWVGNYSRQKGIRNLWEWAEKNETHIDLYGFGVPKVYLGQSKYCHVKVPVLHNQMPDLYRRYKTLVHLPKGREAGSRVFIEALLSGLSILTNEMEGDLSFDRPYSIDRWRSRLRTAPKRFWQIAIEALQT